MIVFLPTFKRTQVLPYVIQSVLNCDDSFSNERILILILNSHYPDKEVINSIVADLDFKGRFKSKVIHRKEPMISVYSWHLAIFENALDKEVIFILGDDDLMMPWGLRNRFNQITNNNADLLISSFNDGLYFISEGKKFILSSKIATPSVIEEEAFVWDDSLSITSGSFVSNHCYRNTENLKNGLKLAIQWCTEQDFVPFEIASGNIPFYTAYAIESAGGTVLQLNEKAVLRGRILEEISFQEYADGGSTSFYGLLIYDTFSNIKLHADISKFSLLRAIYKRSFIVSIVSIFTNKKISNKMLISSIRHSKLGFIDFLTLDIFRNIFRLFPLIRGHRTKRQSKKGPNELTSKLLKDILDLKNHD
jgi:hypothetical protein